MQQALGQHRLHHRTAVAAGDVGKAVDTAAGVHARHCPELLLEQAGMQQAVHTAAQEPEPGQRQVLELVQVLLLLSPPPSLVRSFCVQDAEPQPVARIQRHELEQEQPWVQVQERRFQCCLLSPWLEPF